MKHVRVHLEVRVRLERMLEVPLLGGQLWVPLLGGQLWVPLEVHLVHSHACIGVLQF